MSVPDPTPSPLDHLVLKGASNSPALITRDRTFSFGELDQAVGRMAALLAKSFSPGQRVASWLPKSVEACLLPLATARAGLIHVPINPVLRRAQAAYILADSGATCLITGAGRAATLSDGDLPAGCTLWLELDWQSGDVMGPSDNTPDTVAAILYTSGSTGMPKGVVLSHANMWLGAISVAHFLSLSASDTVLGVLPLSFDYGQNQLLSTWAAGATVVPLDYLTPADVIRAVDRFAVSTLAGVPPLWVQLLAAEWPAPVAAKLKRLTNSGGVLSPVMIDRMRAIFPSADIYPMYGLTEAFRSTCLAPGLVADHPTSMGRAVPFAEIIVARGDGSVTQDDEPGELVHCGPLVAHGYWQDPARTALRYKPAPPSSAYGGMAVWSGDTVRRSSDGLLYFVGRDDEMIKVSGSRVSPTEIEDAAQASGAVAEAVAFGVPDPATGQAIILVATPAGYASDDMLRRYFKRELPSFQVPKSIIWKTQLPRNANGKLDRTAIQSGYAQ